METLRESRKLVFQWVFMCRLIFLEEAEEGKGEEERGEDSYSLTLPTTGGPAVRQRRGPQEGRARGPPAAQGCASQR